MGRQGDSAGVGPTAGDYERLELRGHLIRPLDERRWSPFESIAGERIRVAARDACGPETEPVGPGLYELVLTTM